MFFALVMQLSAVARVAASFLADIPGVLLKPGSECQFAETMRSSENSPVSLTFGLSAPLLLTLATRAAATKVSLFCGKNSHHLLVETQATPEAAGIWSAAMEL